MPAPARTPPVSVALERARPNGVALTAEEQRWDAMVRSANVFAMTSLVPKEMRGNPAMTMAGLLICEAIGVDARTFIGALDVIEGRLEPRAQMYLAAAAVHGWETKWGELKYAYVCDSGHRSYERVMDLPAPCRCGDNRWLTDETARAFSREPDDTRAELLIRPYGAVEWDSFSFTIAQAEQAGLRDEWVEHKTETGEHWPDGNAKYETEKFVLGREGVDVPAWVADELRAGRKKHKDNWWNYPADMLSARAAKRAVKRAAPEVMFGAIPARYRAIPGAATIASFLPDDDEPTDGEVVVKPSALRVPRPEDPTRLASDIERRAVTSVIGQLPPAMRTRLREMAKAAGVPNVGGDAFTHEDAVLLLDLAEQLQPPVSEPGQMVATSPTEQSPTSAPEDATTARTATSTANMAGTLPLDDGRPYED